MKIDRIDLKNFDDDFIKAIEFTFKNNSELKSNTKAVRKACIEYVRLFKENKKLEQKLNKVEIRLREEESKTKEFRDYFALQKKLQDK